MKRHRLVVLAVVACVAVGVQGRSVVAQRQVTVKNRYAQNARPPAPRAQAEELPPGQSPTRSMMAPGRSPVFSDDPLPPEHFRGGGPFEAAPYAEGCCDSCGDCNSYGPTYGDWGGFGPVGPAARGQFFVTADYLAARAHFSESVAFVERVITTTPQQESRDVFHEFEFETESSYRLGGGYRLAGCGEEIRFLYTRLEGFADNTTATVAAPNLFLVPFLPSAVEPFATNPLLRGQATMRASVEVDAFDLEFRKTILLGGASGPGCGDGCGDACGHGCPPWEITWGGGVRAAEVNWGRQFRYLANDTAPLTSGTNNFSRNTVSELEFEGVGPRVGFEGRRYFGCGGWFSTFLKADLSLLWGEVEHDVRQRTILDPTDQTEDVFASQSVRSRQVIPVTDLEAGVSAHISSMAKFSAGYLITAWGDLGFRDEFVGGSALSLETRYDDANILSFDGFFARVEVAY